MLKTDLECFHANRMILPCAPGLKFDPQSFLEADPDIVFS